VSTCHTRFDRGEIDRPSMRQHKLNVGVMNSRYGKFERGCQTLLGQEVGSKFGISRGMTTPSCTSSSRP
jgi:hypothetical protein